MAKPGADKCKPIVENVFECNLCGGVVDRFAHVFECRECGALGPLLSGRMLVRVDYKPEEEKSDGGVEGG